MIYLVVCKPADSSICTGVGPVLKNVVEIMLGESWVSVGPIHCKAPIRNPRLQKLVKVQSEPNIGMGYW